MNLQSHHDMGPMRALDHSRRCCFFQYISWANGEGENASLLIHQKKKNASLLLHSIPVNWCTPFLSFSLSLNWCISPLCKEHSTIRNTVFVSIDSENGCSLLRPYPIAGPDQILEQRIHNNILERRYVLPSEIVDLRDSVEARSRDFTTGS